MLNKPTRIHELPAPEELINHFIAVIPKNDLYFNYDLYYVYDKNFLYSYYFIDSNIQKINWNNELFINWDVYIF